MAVRQPGSVAILLQMQSKGNDLKTPKRISAHAALLAALTLISPYPTAGTVRAIDEEAPAPIETHAVRTTFYLPTGNRMYSGNYPYVGAAACSWNYPIGTQLRFVVDGWVVTCEDRGLLGSSGWVDIFAPNYSWGLANVEGAYGAYTDVEIVRWGR